MRNRSYRPSSRRRRLTFIVTSVTPSSAPPSRTLLAGKQRTNLGNQLCRDRHQRNVLGLARRLDVGKLLVLGLAFVMRDQLLYALLIPARGKFLLAHFGFLR